jgi:translation initiation factor IF-3
LIKRHKKFTRDEKRNYRINERISALEMRVLDSDNKQIGVLKKYEALEKSRALGLDLVEIAPLAKPVVVKIIDFNKFLYQQEKKKREEKRKAKVSETKEVRLGPFMEDHDLDVMTRRAREFLEDGDKVRFVVKFIGRQIAHPEFGNKVLAKVLGKLDDIAIVERDAHFEGKQLSCLVTAE